MDEIEKKHGKWEKVKRQKIATEGDERALI